MWSKWWCVSTIWLTARHSHGMHVSGDRPRLWQRRTTVDQHGSVPTADEAHGDVEKRKTATEHAVGQPFPAELTAPA